MLKLAMQVNFFLGFVEQANVQVLRRNRGKMVFASEPGDLFDDRVHCW